MLRSPPVLGLALLSAMTTAVLASAALGQDAPPAEPPKQAAPPAPAPAPTEAVLRAPTLNAQRADLRCFHEVGDSLRIAGAQLAFRRAGGHLFVSGAVTGRLADSSTIEVPVGEGATKRTLALHFRRAPPPPHAKPAPGKHDGAPEEAPEEPAWHVANLTARAVTIGDRTVHLIDANLDGRYDGFDRDGLALPGNPLVIPLRRHLVLGRRSVELLTIEPGGTTVAFRATPVEGTEHQLAALEQVNAYRWDMGLPPVQLDPQLSAACTSHATYLEKNGWSGYSDPHTQDPEQPGATPEGAAVARRAVIMQARVHYALDSFWRSYYHRIDLMDPSLEFVGVNTGPHWIVVIDAKEGVGAWDVVDAGWSDPVLCPADGQTGFPTSFCRRGEAPAPVSRAAARGNPLMANFTMDDRVITKFSASLVRLTAEGQELGVEVLSANQRHAVHVFGAIPRAPLAPDTRYRVTYHYEANGKPETRSATFRTAP